MNTQELLIKKLELNRKSMEASQALTTYCAPFRGAMGLVSDECRSSDEYKRLKTEYNRTLAELRTFNFEHRKNKELQKAIRDEINQRRVVKAVS